MLCEPQIGIPIPNNNPSRTTTQMTTEIQEAKKITKRPQDQKTSRINSSKAKSQMT